MNPLKHSEESKSKTKKMETLDKTITKNKFIKYSVTTYYLLTFLISWGGLIIIMGGLDRITSKPTTTPFIFAYLVTLDETRF